MSERTNQRTSIRCGEKERVKAENKKRSKEGETESERDDGGTGTNCILLHDPTNDENTFQKSSATLGFCAC